MARRQLIRNPRAWLCGAGLGLFLASAAWAALPPQPAKALDTNRFVGRWYEIARMPNNIQNGCATSLADWSHATPTQFNVVQTCHVDTPTGRAKVWKA